MQVTITNETTLETIEGIGTSSFKIKEWRQTTGRYLSECQGEVVVQWHTWHSMSKYKWVVTLHSSTWNAEFVQTRWWIRIPKAWTYRFTYSGGQVWGYNRDSTFYIKNWPNFDDKTIFQHTATWGYDTISGSFIVDLWKFDIITAWADFTYNGSWTGEGIFDDIDYLTIQQL